tara:strand:+ start:8975 stop:9841 length:867 start_codon:yes stop_codon:yes gene_type:complete
MKRRWSIDPNTKIILKQAATGFLVFGLFALILTGIWYGTRYEAVTISSVKVEGGETVDHSAVVKLAELELDGKYLNFVPRRFAWFYPREDIMEAVGSIERLHSIEVDRVSGTEIFITFEEYTPTALWCESLEAYRCMFMSSDALAYTTAPQLTGGSLLRFSHLNEEPERGKYLVSKETFKSLLELVELLADYDWYVSAIEVDSTGDAFMHLTGGGELKIQTTDEPEQVVENFLVILGSEEFNHLEPGNFKYVDLRFGSKVFVNEKTTPDEAATSSATSSEPELSSDSQ